MTLLLSLRSPGRSQCFSGAHVPTRSVTGQLTQGAPETCRAYMYIGGRLHNKYSQEYYGLSAGCLRQPRREHEPVGRGLKRNETNHSNRDSPGNQITGSTSAVNRPDDVPEPFSLPARVCARALVAVTVCYIGGHRRHSATTVNEEFKHQTVIAAFKP